MAKRRKLEEEGKNKRLNKFDQKDVNMTLF
jgi:hypothetical protein